MHENGQRNVTNSEFLADYEELPFLEVLTEAEQKEEQFRREEAFDELDMTCHLLALSFDVVIEVEQSRGDTHFVHVAGSAKEVLRYKDDLQKRRRTINAKWMVIPYKGVFGKWMFKRWLKHREKQQ